MDGGRRFTRAQSPLPGSVKTHAPMFLHLYQYTESACTAAPPICIMHGARNITKELPLRAGIIYERERFIYIKTSFSLSLSLSPSSSAAEETRVQEKRRVPREDRALYCFVAPQLDALGPGPILLLFCLRLGAQQRTREEFLTLRGASAFRSGPPAPLATIRSRSRATPNEWEHDSWRKFTGDYNGVCILRATSKKIAGVVSAYRSLANSQLPVYYIV